MRVYSIRKTTKLLVLCFILRAFATYMCNFIVSLSHIRDQNPTRRIFRPTLWLNCYRVYCAWCFFLSFCLSREKKTNAVQFSFDHSTVFRRHKSTTFNIIEWDANTNMNERKEVIRPRKRERERETKIEYFCAFACLHRNKSVSEIYVKDTRCMWVFSTRTQAAINQLKPIEIN